MTMLIEWYYGEIYVTTKNQKIYFTITVRGGLILTNFKLIKVDEILFFFYFKYMKFDSWLYITFVAQ